MNDDEIKKVVRDGYAKVAEGPNNCCAPSVSCCGDTDMNILKAQSVLIGYDPDELDSIPEGAVMGLGCGNPIATADIEEGETVLDLGSGPGIDCFLAAKRVGPEGRVIGIDMTPEMLELARRNAEDGDFGNVEFRLGEIEDLPVEDGTVDVIISNCVINLSPDKSKVFQEAFRVLRPGGRMMVSDIVLEGELPDRMRTFDAYVGCVAGALQKDDYLAKIATAGFEDVEIVDEVTYPGLDVIRSVKVKAYKPD